MNAQIQNQIIRQPAVAGQFYPENPNELNQIIDNFLKNVELPEIQGKPKILIVPHAGYVFSGQTASYGFKALETHTYNTVIILGPSHNFPISGLVLYNGDIIKTPLGDVLVNKKLVEKLIQDNNISVNNNIHIPEHSLEVQLPFLQKVLTNGWQVVLGLINNDDENIIESISQIIQENTDENTLIIASSDLSHYPAYDYAIYSDNKIIESILTKDGAQLENTTMSIIEENIPGLDTCACGASAIKIAMHIANNLNLDGQLLNYANSGNTEFGGKDKVVGYASIVFTANNSEQTIIDNQKLNLQEQQIALKLARNTLELEFGIADKKFEKYKNYPMFSQKRGVFVTLNINHSLRGCIGIIEPIQPLAQAIINMAESAAFNDPRFQPLAKEEFKNVTIEISVLTPPKKIDNIQKIELGKHGVIIRQGLNSGVFLPQVAIDTGWSLEEFLNHLCQDKADLSQNCWQNPSVEIYTFEAQVLEE
ncbi:MAG: AmmeMemoRadiSam system protein B [Candidatus Kuenenbacteria bacterium]